MHLFQLQGVTMINNNQTSKWKIVLIEELRQLWGGWKGILFLFFFSLFLSFFTLSISLDPEINALSHAKWIFLMSKIITFGGMLATLLLSANSISGARENGTLESLLLTPVKTMHLLYGKMLAILSLWIGMYFISIPYLFLITKGTELFFPTALQLGLFGTLLVGMTIMIGTLVSSFSEKNITSFIISFAIVLALIAPVGLPGSLQAISPIDTILAIDPYSAAINYQGNILLNQGIGSQNNYLLLSPILSFLLLLFFMHHLIRKYFSLQGGFGK